MSDCRLTVVVITGVVPVVNESLLQLENSIFGYYSKRQTYV